MVIRQLIRDQNFIALLDLSYENLPRKFDFLQQELYIKFTGQYFEGQNKLQFVVLNHIVARFKLEISYFLNILVVKILKDIQAGVFVHDSSNFAL